MALANQAPALAIFVGGCLSGAALLSLASPASDQDPHAQVPSNPDPTERAATPADDDSQSQAALGEPEADRDAQHGVIRMGAETAVPTGEADHFEGSGESAAEVLARLEAQYQAEQAGRSAAEAPTSELDNAAPPTPSVQQATPPAPDTLEDPSALALHDEDAEDELAADNEEASLGAQAANAHSGSVRQGDARQGDVHQGDIHQGDIHSGSVHEGDVNQVQQLTLLTLQQVIVLPPNETKPHTAPAVPNTGASVSIVGSVGTSSVDPWAHVRFSPSQDPWTTTRMSPRHDPWRSSRTVPGNPWGPTFGRRP